MGKHRGWSRRRRGACLDVVGLDHGDHTGSRRGGVVDQVADLEVGVEFERAERAVFVYHDLVVRHQVMALSGPGGSRSRLGRRRHDNDDGDSWRSSWTWGSSCAISKHFSSFPW
jgi:hypothetical protein